MDKRLAFQLHEYKDLQPDIHKIRIKAKSHRQAIRWPLFGHVIVYDLINSAQTIM